LWCHNRGEERRGEERRGEERRKGPLLYYFIYLSPSSK